MLQLVIEEEIIKRGISHLHYLRAAVVAKALSGEIRVNNLKLFFFP